jgi:potassium inwardly-rectifying channel subfamily J
MLTWLIFAVIWWIISYAHGDFEKDNLPGGKNQESGDFIPCVWAIHNFASCFLFSVETQHTIGYVTLILKKT